MRFPKKVSISGKTYSVGQDKTKWGGHGHTSTQHLVVGTRSDQTEERKFENFMHEVAEMVACEQHSRYEASDDEVVFVMNHRQFDRFVSDISSVVYPMVKGK